MICQTKKHRNQLALLRLASFIIILCTGSAAAIDNKEDEIEHSSFGNIGCLFVDGLCNSNENCFDDNAFGKCIDLETSDSKDLYGGEEDSDRLEQLSQPFEDYNQPDFYISDDGHLFIPTESDIFEPVNDSEGEDQDSIEIPSDLTEKVISPDDILLNYDDLDSVRDEESKRFEIPIHLQGIDSSDTFNRHKFSLSKRSHHNEDHLFQSNPEATFEDQDNSEELPNSNQEFFILPTVGDDSTLTIFNRNERFDVKKPGPFFPNSENNFFLNKILVKEADLRKEQDDSIIKDPFGPNKNGRSNEKGQIEFEQPLLAPVKDKRLLKVLDAIDGKDQRENDFVHIYLNNRLHTWLQGADMIRHLAKELGVPNEALTNRLIEDHHVQFKVEPNPQNINAEKMATLLGQNIEIKKRMADKFGIGIENVLAGHQHDLPDVLYTKTNNFYTIVGLTIACATITGLVVSLAVLVLIKKRRKTMTLKENLMEQEEEDSRLRDQYSELCRDWSNTTKSASGLGEANNSGNKDNETKAPLSSMKKLSSRESSKDLDNSTKGEELTASNMDISTGHMVLAYMEDHLKNKQRLEQEWVALCGYEAEPCATTVAFKTENKKKNRYPDKLPYDHNRVILNALLNANSSDYINASTVTDHDPRNPPYIVTQGPLSQTVADFWQMVWEQGCVVIVMLTRLQDNGYHLCHRYWPEEGSEKYNIFEVHLVSEHVWCDDYLVRSVYLKNTRTGETRTVTQFHFRSWPAHGVPTSTKALLEFRRKVNKSYRGRSCPIIVHCSDGVGRAGTYTLIDMVLNRISKGCKEIDIAATLEHIRDQRGGMVQTRQQFEFCLMAVAEEVHAILKALPQ